MRVAGVESVAEALVEAGREVSQLEFSFVHMFHGRPSANLWGDAGGTVPTGEQGDALMPLLFSLGQHSGLEATHRRLRVNEKLFAYLDDVHIASKPDKAGAAHASLEENLFGHARIRIHTGKTHMWNKFGVERLV